MKSILAYGSGLLLAMVQYLLGVVLATERLSLRADAMFLYGVQCPLLIFAAFGWYQKMRIERGQKCVDAEQAGAMLTRAAQRDIGESKRALRSAVLFARAYILVCFLLLGACEIVAGMALSAGGIGISVLLAFASASMTAKLVFGHTRVSYGEIDSKRYPELFRLIHEVFGKRPRMTVVAAEDIAAGISRVKRRPQLQLGAFVVPMLTREEMKQVFLHEKAHLLNGDVQLSASACRARAILEADDAGAFSVFADILFAWPTAKLAQADEMYTLTATRAAEFQADEYAKEHGNRAAYISALAKIEMFSLFKEHEDLPLVYDAPEPVRDLISRTWRQFQETLPSREMFWRKIIEGELPPLLGSHPTFRQRWEMLGKPAYEISFHETGAAFDAERRDYLLYMDEAARKIVSNDYAQLREHQYIRPLKIAEAYEAALQAGKEIPVRELTPAIDAYFSLARYDDMLTVCERAIRESRSPYEAAHAHFRKGLRMLARFDARGIEEMDLAMDADRYYEPEVLDAVGDFCLQMGLSRELEAYRIRVRRVAQRAMDMGEGWRLSARHKLAAEDRLNAERRDADIAFIRDTCGDRLIALYVVKREIGKARVQTAYIVKLRDAEDESLEEQLSAILRYLDTSPDNWAYGLYLSYPALEKKLRKTPGALVFENVGTGTEC